MASEVRTHHMAKRFIECIRYTFFFQHVTQPTRIRDGFTTSTLDLILSNEEDIISKINYHPSLGKSDHLILTYDFNCYTILDSNSKTKSRLDFFKCSYENIKNELQAVDWGTTLNGLDLLLI